MEAKICDRCQKPLVDEPDQNLTFLATLTEHDIESGGDLILGTDGKWDVCRECYTALQKIIDARIFTSRSINMC